MSLSEREKKAFDEFMNHFLHRKKHIITMYEHEKKMRKIERLHMIVQLNTKFDRLSKEMLQVNLIPVPQDEIMNSIIRSICLDEPTDQLYFYHRKTYVTHMDMPCDVVKA